MDRTRTLLSGVALLLLAIVLAIGLAACSSADSGTTTEPAATDNNGTADQPAAGEDPEVALVETKCSLCHSTDRVWSASKTREEWVTTVDRMEKNGLVVTQEEYTRIVDYLASQ